MVRNTSIIIGIGLAILWVVGLSHHATPWLVWLDGLAAALAFGGAFMMPSDRPLGRMVIGPAALCLGLAALWIGGLATRAEGWLTWWTFVFACAFLVVSLLAGSERPISTTRAA